MLHLFISMLQLLSSQTVSFPFPLLFYFLDGDKLAIEKSEIDSSSVNHVFY